MRDTAARAVAIVGVGAVMPDAADAPTFWNNIKSGRYSVSEVPAARWNAELYFDADPAAPDKTYSTIGGWALSWTWDPLAWKLPVPPRVSASMDRGQKWAVITAREALGDYGYPERPLDPERTAVIIGTALGGDRSVFSAARLLFPEVAEELRRSPTFAQLAPQQQRAILEEGLSGYRRRMPDVTEDAMPGELANIVAGRVAALFNFRGPNYIVDAACASATAAISTAIEGLVQGDYDAVVTGGVDANMSPSSFIKFCKVGALSARGTRPFAAGADGFVMGEGAAAFLLKRLADAERDGDRVYAVIRGVGGSSDGRGKGITAPNPIGQKLAVRRAWEHAGLSPDTLTLMEAHGTSTRVGDATEVASLNEVFGNLGLPIGGIALGSVKSNIGHLKGAAGAAGLLKAVLALHDKVLPPSLGFDQPNPNIDFARSPFRVNTELRPWELPAGGVRRAAVSSFGFGGTNFHAVLEEHRPGRLTQGNRHSVHLSGARGEGGLTTAAAPVAGSGGAVAAVSPAKVPLRGAMVLGAATASALAERLQQVCAAAQAGRVPPPAAPALAELRAPERVAIDYGDAAELASKSAKALKALAGDQLGTWKALRAQGIFRGRGAPPKVAFLYTGQGSQYVNMLQLLRRQETVVAEVFAEADRVMGPLLGRPLSDYIFVDGADGAEVARAEEDLRQTAITQPAVLAADEALTRLLAAYGIAPDMVMGHSLGEYGALVAAGALPFGEALEAVSARGREMTRVAMGESGAMAAVFAPLAEIERIVAGIEGYVVVANHNSRSQAVVGGTVAAVQRAVAAFEAAGFRAVPLTVSHAFHTKLVAPASAPLAEVLRRLHLQPPRLPLVANLSGQFYPTGPDAVPQMVEILGQQVAAPVQFIQGLRTLHAAGARVFVEVGPKKALHGFVEDVLGDEPEVSALFTNHPRQGDVVSFNQALCGLYAAGLGRAHEEAGLAAGAASSSAAAGGGYQRLGELAAEFIERGIEVFGGRRLDGRRAEDESVVITGAALGLPGGARIFDPTNVERILRGDQLIDTLPLRLRREILAKNIVRLVKTEAGAHFEPIAQLSEVVKLAGRGGSLDLTAEFGYPADRLPALDIVTRLAIAAGLDALHDAGLPLVQHYKTTTRGTQLPAGWRLPAALRDDTGVIFASSFPGYDALVADLKHYYTDRSRRERLAELESLLARASAADPLLRTELERRIDALRGELEREGYQFDRRFVLKVLPMGHSQLADLIGARGPNTHVNAACASTTHALSVAEDWLRRGRCRRVLVVSGDDVTSDHMMEWFGSGFLASGAAATDELVEEAAVPFDRRRHGLILGMGASAIVLETASAARERGVRPICELLGSLTANSAFHATRLDVDHICGLMEQLIGDAERQWRLDRRELARRLLFVSHETYTPARGGSAQAEVEALRRTFGADAEQILVANTKGLTGHAMGVGIEDVVAIKALETGVVPPVPNYRDPDPELGALNLSRGGAYDVGYALRLGAGFGSQISLALLRWFPTADGRRPAPNALGYATRVDDRAQWEAWLARISGQAAPELELVQRTLRIKDPLRPTLKDRGTAASSAPSPAPNAVVAPPRQAVAAAPTAAAPAAAVVPVAPVPVQEPVTSRGVAAAMASAPRVLGSAGLPTAPPSGSVAAVSTPDEVLAQVLQLVAESTGYAPDMLDPDLDLEADLGIDTVKQAETFAQVRERYAIPRDEGLRLRDFPTLRHVTQFVYDHRPDLRAAQQVAPTLVAAAAPVQNSKTVAVAPVPPVVPAGTPAVASAVSALPAPVARPGAAPAADAVLSQITELVAEGTGYAADMLDPDLDLEADLGIDTVKQAETFAQVRERYAIPRDEGLRLRDFPTLRHVTQFVYDHRPELRVAQRGVPASTAPAVGSAAPAASGAPAPSPMVPAPVSAPVSLAPAPAAAPPAAGTDAVLSQITQLVAESTGYAADMLDPDLDLEADLGIDTVKQAETFAQVRERYAIPRDEGLRLRDFPTLRHVTQFVYDHRPELRVAQQAAPTRAAATAPVVGSTAPAASGAPAPSPVVPAPVSAPVSLAPAPAAAPPAAGTDPVLSQITQLVAESTGYAADMLDPDLDLEADLGIDTVKQAETFAQVRERYAIPRDEGLRLRDFPTLRHVTQFVYDHRPELRVAQRGVPASTAPAVGSTAPAASGAPAPSPVVPAPVSAPVSLAPAPAAAPPAAGTDAVLSQITQLVAESTGYAADMLDPDLDLEADLGIDTVKQAETFAQVRERYAIPRDEGLRLRDFPTLRHVTQFVYDHRPDLRVARSAPAAAPAAAAALPDAPAPSVSDDAKAAPTLLQASAEAMDAVPRRVPVPQLRPALECCKPTGVTLDPRSRVIVMLDRGGVGSALVARLEQLGVVVLAIDDAPPSAALLARLAAFGAAGPVQGIYWLPALDAEGDFTALTPAAFREALRVRVKLLHATARALYDQFARAETFLVAATRLGGLHGYETAGPLASLGGAVSGFVKALKRERAQALVKCVDFARDDDAARAAALLLDETQRDAGVVEVGYHEGLRWTVGLSNVPLALPPGPALPLAPAGERPVFVVTGAAGSIVAAIVADLARAWPGVFYLLDRVPEPTADDPDLQRFRADREALKRELFARRKAQGERVTPAQIEKELAGLERAAAAQAASAAVQAAGGEVRYRRLDLLDAAAVAQVLDEVRREHGRIDVLLHAAGVEISHFLPDKEPAEFDLVFDVKAEGWFNLLHAARGLPLGTTVVFSSIAGRFGNGGQTDYSAANDLLCKTSAALPRLWPGTRAISIDWTAWGGLGMAARGSIPKLMERAGIDMLVPEAGIGIVRRELQAEGLGAVEVLVAGRLGLLLEEFDATGGLDPLAQPAGVSGPMLTRATAMSLHGGLAAEVTLDPGEQPFLFDHRIDGTALLPGVMGIEAFAEAARWALPSWQVVAVEQVAFAAPFKFYRGEPRTVTVNAQLQRDGEFLLAQCHLVGVRQLSGQHEPQASTHFSGRVRLGRERPSALQAEPPRLTGHPRVLAADIYRVYFHGPAYQVLEAAWRDGEVVYGLLPAQLPPHHRPETLATVMAPRLIELCFQTAGVYELGVLGRMGLPAQVDRVDTLRDPATAEGRLCAVVRPNPAGSATFDAASFDAYVTDEAGKVFVTLRGYRTVALPGGVSESARAPLRSAIG